MVTPGYGRVHDEYQSILGKPWVYAKTKYKIGPDPNLSADFRTCAYGLVAVEGKLDRLLSALDDAEAALRTTPPPDPIPDFRIDWLHQDLRNAGIPIEGLNVSEKPTPETDANPEEYFKLSNGKYIRATKPKDVTFTAEQREKARELIHIHEETLKRQEPLLEAVRIALARGGQTVSSVRFTRSASELTFDPQRFISIDTAMGILEIRGRAPFSAEQRERIEEIVKSELIKTLTPP